MEIINKVEQNNGCLLQLPGVSLLMRLVNHYMPGRIASSQKIDVNMDDVFIGDLELIPTNTGNGWQANTIILDSKKPYVDSEDSI